MTDAIADTSVATDPAPVADSAPAAPIAPSQPAPIAQQPDAGQPTTHTDTTNAEPVGDWPADWRQKYSNDPKVLKRLERYASPKAALDALFAAQNKISSGELKSALKPDATPEERAAWREDNGIPATPKDYDLTLPNGIVVGEADRPFIDSFLEKAHAANMHPTQVKEALGWYYDQQEQTQAAMIARDEESRMKAEDELRAEFGPEYRRNVAMVKQLLDSAPEGVRDRLLDGRMSDGTPIGNDPAVIRWLVGLSRELNPVGTVVPGSGTNAVQAVETELAGLRKMMGDHKSDYWRGPMAATHQERYRKLTSALSKGGQR